MKIKAALITLLLTIVLVSAISANVESKIQPTARVVWEYRETPDFFSQWGGDADRLPNGNTLITDCTNGRILEVTMEGEKVWEVFVEDWDIYRSERIPDLDLSETALYNPDGYPTPYDITVSIWVSDKACNGITFIPAWGYLWAIDMSGKAVWRYEGTWNEQKMLDNGHLLLLRKEISDKKRDIREIDLDGNLYFNISTNVHHDVVKPTPFHLMYIANDVRLYNGRRIVGDEIRAMTLSDEKIVWQWNTFEHLPWDHYCPECLKLRSWTHSNSLTFMFEDSRAIVYLNVRNLNQIVKIDVATKEIIWKLGEKGDFKLFEKDGTEVTKLFSHSHDPEFLPNGNILLFDNGEHRGGPEYSRVIEIELAI